MTNKFKNKYRIYSARLVSWNYANEGSYFVTICTKNRKHFFGKIVQGIDGAEMQLNEIGKIVEQEWIKTVEIRKDMNLELGEFIVMPNHFHGIIIIGENECNGDEGRDAMHRRDAMRRVSTGNVVPNKFSPQSKNLGSIIRGFKSAVTTKAKKIGLGDFGWQSRYHDHVIRNYASFERIQNYIADNPKSWKQDAFYFETRE